MHNAPKLVQQQWINLMDKFKKNKQILPMSCSPLRLASCLSSSSRKLDNDRDSHEGILNPLSSIGVIALTLTAMIGKTAKDNE